MNDIIAGDLISREEALERLRCIPADLGKRELEDALKAIEECKSYSIGHVVAEIKIPEEQWKECIKKAAENLREEMQRINNGVWNGHRFG